MKTQLSPQPEGGKGRQGDDTHAGLARFLTHLLSASTLPGSSSIHFQVGQNVLTHEEIVHSHSIKC